ncbi:MAG: hypothetical protein NT007_08595 [Candidatus Kapabacteria bacterium]|nr:hypothetical protein [Candidatus Kapabacteria bacterium]
MKKLLSILFILIYLVNIIGSISIFLFQQSRHRSEVWSQIKSKISSEEISVIHLSKSEMAQALHFEDNTNEFYYKGELYDIIRTTETYDSLIIYCLNDKTEEKLKEKFVKENSKTNENSNSQKRIELKLFNLIAQINNKIDLLYFYQTDNINVYIANFNYSTNFFPELQTPPPKIHS